MMLAGLVPAGAAGSQEHGSSAARRDSARADSARADSVQRLLAVTVSASRSVRASPLLQATAVTVTDAAQLAATPTRILPDALRETPGVQVQQTNAGHGSVILRGMTGNQVLVLVDGLRLNTATVRDGPNQYMSTIDPERIDRIEVIRGPGSVLYGGDAMGGVINVVTKHPGAITKGSAAISYASSDDGLRAHIEGNLGGGRVRARGGMSYTASSDIEAGGEIGVQPGTGYSSVAGDASVEVQLRPCQRLSLSGQAMDLRGVSRFDRLVAFRAFDVATNSRSYGPDAEFEFDPQTHVLSTLHYDAVGCGGIIPRRGVVVGYQLQREGRVQRSWEWPEPDVPEPSPMREYQRDDTHTRLVTFYVEPRAPMGVSLRFGGDIYRDDVSSWGYQETVLTSERRPLLRVSGTDSVPAGRFPDGARATTMGVYAHGAHLIGKRLRVLTGLRFDATHVALRAGDEYGGDVDERTRNIAGQLGVATFFDNGVSVSAHAGQGFRAPNIYDYATVSTVPGGIVLPSAGVKPERSTTVEGAVRKTWDRASASLVGYATDLSGFIDRVPGSYRGDTLLDGRRVFRAANIGQARITGLELHGDARVRRLVSIRGQGFWTHGAQTAPGGTGEEPVTRIPPLSGSVALRRDVLGESASGWVELVARGAGEQRRLSSRDVRDSRIQAGGTPGFWTLGVRTAVARGQSRLTAGLENVLDRGYREHGSGIDAPGRHIWVRFDIGRP